jgi:hypothetical protein
LIFSNDNLDTTTVSSLVFVASYFILLEFLPTLLATVFYRVRGNDFNGNFDKFATYDDLSSMTSEESKPLTSDLNSLKDNLGDSVEIGITERISFTGNKINELDSQTQDVVATLIQKLSVKTPKNR